jgi:hypothetical protein
MRNGKCLVLFEQEMNENGKCLVLFEQEMNEEWQLSCPVRTGYN